jgi:hypothetical protein
VPIDRDVIDAVKDMDEHDLRRLLILAQARLEQQGIEFPVNGPSVRLRRQWIRCGKATCRTCPHGPYWYAVWSEDGKRRSRYVGKLEDDSTNPSAVAADGSSRGR